MARLKGKFVTAFSRGLGIRRTLETPRFRMDGYFRLIGSESILGKKPKPRKEPTEAQLRRRACYDYCDELWRNLTDGQLALWKRFYWYSRALGRTLKHVAKRKITGEIKETKKHMGYRAFFMKRCLTENLDEYTYLWLKGKWRLVKRWEEDGNVCLELEIIHREDVEIPTEPRELKVERIRG